MDLFLSLISNQRGLKKHATDDSTIIYEKEAFGRVQRNVKKEAANSL